MPPHYRYVLLVVGLALLVYCLVMLLTDATWPVPLVTLPADQVLQYLQKRHFMAIDVVLIPPFVMDGDKNLTVVSVLRFMPWFRRLHIYDPDYQLSRDPTQYWQTHQKAKVVFFHQDLLEYTLTTPFLEERFVLLRPLFVLGNYAFMWQFFIDESPVLRSCQTGLLPLTRSIFNECSYTQVEDKYAYAVRKGVADHKIRYWDNRDHFVPPCSASPVATVQEVGAVYEAAQVRELLQFEEIKKDRTTRPAPIVLAVMAAPQDDLTYVLPARYDATVQVWVHLTELTDSDLRLSFTHRMIVSRNVFVELYLKGLQYNTEKMGAEVMKQLKTLSHQEDFQVLEVFSYPTDAQAQQPNFTQRLANELGNKLARTYACPFSPFSRNEPVKDEREWQRLLRL